MMKEFEIGIKFTLLDYCSPYKKKRFKDSIFKDRKTLWIEEKAQPSLRAHTRRFPPSN